MTPRYNTCALMKMLVCVWCVLWAVGAVFCDASLAHSIQEVTPFESSPEPPSSAPLRWSLPLALLPGSGFHHFSAQGLPLSFAKLRHPLPLLRLSSLCLLGLSSHSCRRRLLSCSFFVFLRRAAASFFGLFVDLGDAVLCYSQLFAWSACFLCLQQHGKQGLSASLLQGCCLCQDVQGLHPVHLWVCCQGTQFLQVTGRESGHLQILCELVQLQKPGRLRKLRNKHIREIPQMETRHRRTDSQETPPDSNPHGCAQDREKRKHPLTTTRADTEEKKER